MNQKFLIHIKNILNEYFYQKIENIYILYIVKLYLSEILKECLTEPNS